MGSLTILTSVQVRVTASGDNTGLADSQMINAVTAAGRQVLLDAGTFYLDGNVLAFASGMRITGQGYQSTVVNVVGHPLNAAASQTDNVEIAHLTLQATGLDLFTGANCLRWNIHHCQFIQNSAGNAIWNAPSATLMVECRFEKNTEHVSGATRSIEAWFLSSNAVNQNVWRDNVCFNDGNDATRYFYHLQSTTGANDCNSFQNIVFEKPYGGMIWLESHIRGLVEHCIAWDIAATVSGHLIHVTKNAGGLASNSNTIINSPRVSAATFAAGIGDINLDANCVQTTIVAPQAPNSGTTLVLHLGASTGVKLVNLPPGTSIADSASTAVAGAGAGTGPPAPVVNAGPVNEAGNVTFGTGTAPAAGNMFTLTFGTPFSNSPEILISPVNGLTAALQPYVVPVSATQFRVATAVAPAASQANTTYSVNWYAIS